MATEYPESDAKTIFEPEDVPELLRGWLLHAHKGRERHDRAARKCNSHRLWVGVPAAVLSAIVGATVTLEKVDIAAPVKDAILIAIPIIAILAAILTSLTTFLGLPERTEKHRSAGVRYKIAIRELERILSAPLDKMSNTDPPVAGMKKQLDDLEESAPVVPERLYNWVEDGWKKRGVEFKGKANELYILKH